MIRIISLNELTLLRFLILVLLRRHVYILSVKAMAPPLQNFLDAVSKWALGKERVKYAIELVPDMTPYWEYDRRFHFHEAFKKYEAWQDRYYDFENASNYGPLYGYAYKQVVTNYVFTNVLEIFLLNALVGKLPDGGFRIWGVLSDTLAMYMAYFGKQSAPGISTTIIPNRLINGLIGLSVGLYSLGWVFSRLRFGFKTTEVFLAADYIHDQRDFNIYEELSDGGEILLVVRMPIWQGKQQSKKADEYRQCRPKDGVFSPGGSIEAAVMVLSDFFKLWRGNANKTPALFYRIVTMPHKRSAIRALFNIFRPKFFWGRDDYNVEHILRRSELHRVGGKSLGVSHAVITNFCSLFPQWRYISFDIYYAVGVPLCRPYFSKWPEDMELRSAGVFTLPRELINKPWPLGEDILIASRVAWYEPEMKNIAREVAKAFPQRKILLQMKPGYLSEDIVNKMAAEWCHGLSNMEHVTDGIYDLLPRARYLISDVSSLIGETLQLGLPTLFADVIEMEYSIFREFPGLSVKNAGEAVARLKALDSGDTPDPHKEYLKIMGLDHGRTIYDIVRDDMGLAARK